jgi:hypothetical protein
MLFLGNTTHYYWIFCFTFGGKKIDSNLKKKSKLRSWVNAAPMGEINFSFHGISKIKGDY